MRQREPRRKVLVRARMRAGGEWGDVLIHNMSSRGLLATTEAGCATGTVVEIRRLHHVIVGRVVWQRGAHFGIRTQDPIDIDAVVAAKPTARSGALPDRESDRRHMARRARPAAERAAQSRRFAGMFQFVVLVLAIGAASLIVADQVGGILARPFAAIDAQLGDGTKEALVAAP